MHNLTKFYISCPMQEYKRIQAIEDSFNSVFYSYGFPKDVFHRLDWWTHGTGYSEKPLLESDVIIIVLPSNGFRSNSDLLTKGSRKEIELAMSNNKKFLLAYRKSGEQEYGFYKVNITSDKVEAIAGTANDFKEYFKIYNNFTQKELHDKLQYNKIKPNPPLIDNLAKEENRLILLRKFKGK